MGFDVSAMRQRMRTENGAPMDHAQAPAGEQNFVSAQQVEVQPSSISQPFGQTGGPLLTVSQPNRHPVVDTTPKAHTATRGLFAHIQANNAKSLLLVAVFLLSVFIAQAALFVAIMPLHLEDAEIVSPVTLFVGGRNQVALQAQTSKKTDALFAPISRELSASKPSKLKREQLAAEKKKLDDAVRDAGGWGSNGLLGTAGFLSELSDIWRVVFASGILLQWDATYLLMFGAGYVLLAVIFSSIFVKRQAGATRIGPEEARLNPQSARLWRMVENLAASRGLPMPAVEVIDSSACNAYAGGFHPKNSSIGVTRGLLDNLNDLELEAVLAHEIAHIEGRDNRLMTIANFSSGLVSHSYENMATTIFNRPLYAVIVLFFFLIFASLAKLLVVAVLYTIAYLIGECIRMMISRRREFIADARAIEFVKMPAALILALRKVSQNDQIEGLDRNAQAMMISNLSGAGLPTHPTIEARIRAIEETTTVNNTDFVALQRMKSPVQQPASVASAPTGFGKRQSPGQLADDFSVRQTGPVLQNGEQQSKTVGFGTRRSLESVVAARTQDQPLIENERLEKVYRASLSLDKGVSKASSGIFKFWLFGSFLLPLVAVPAIIVGSIIGELSGIGTWPSVVLLAAGALYWRYRRRMRLAADSVEAA